MSIFFTHAHGFQYSMAKQPDIRLEKKWYGTCCIVLCVFVRLDNISMLNNYA